MRKNASEKSKRGLYIFFASILILCGIAMFEGYYQYMVKVIPKNSTQTEIVFEISPGESLNNIALRLKKLHLINSPFIFLTYLKRENLDKTIQAGEYNITDSVNIKTLVKQLQKAQDKQRTITILEGWSNKDIGLYLDKEGIPADSFENCLNICVFTNHFINETIRKNKYEGFLFPDTYRIALSPTSEQIIGKMLDNFENQITRIKTNNTDNIFNDWVNEHSLYDKIIVASLIERESKTLKDRPIVSGIIWKRLQKNIGLGIDATYLYVLGDWNAEITTRVLNMDSPYNTRKYTGLPPTPICQPSLNSINAAFNPIDTDYLYYLTSKSGEMIYSKTLDEHNRNKRKYLQ